MYEEVIEMDDFLHKDVTALDRRVFRLGLATNFGIDGKDLEWALGQGMNYVFWPATARKVTESLKAALRRDRESIILASGPTFGYFAGGIRSGCEKLLKRLGTDYIDIFQLFWLGRGSAWTESTIEALVSLRESGLVRKIGVSIHDRERAGRLAEDSQLDLLMIRYNAAHRGAEQDIFPRLSKRRPAVVCYTATRWGALLKRPKGWGGPLMTPADCYRFCLSNPHVDIVLTGPKNRRQLEENLAGVKQRGLLSAEEADWMSELGNEVHQRSSMFTFRF